MQRYIDSTLISDEEIILTPEMHQIVYAKPFIILGLYFIFMLIIGLIDPTTWLTLGYCLNSYCSLYGMLDIL